MKFTKYLPALIAICLSSSSSTAKGELILGVTNSNFLISWDSSAPGSLLSGTAITGLQINEQIIGIDVRPRTSQLFAVGSSSRVYVIDSMTGAASQLGSQFSPVLSGSQFGYDFNPAIDRSRLVSDTRANYVINPDTGGIVRVTDVFYDNGDPNFGVSPNIVHLAYNNNVDGTSTTQLFSIDSGLDILARQANSAGTLTSVGGLGVDINGLGGFDISGVTGRGFAALMQSGSSESDFFEINLVTGQASLVGQIGGGNTITAMTIARVPEPSTCLLAFAGMGISCFSRRRRIG